jgi:hyperosmotically inducible protein
MANQEALRKTLIAAALGMMMGMSGAALADANGTSSESTSQAVGAAVSDTAITTKVKAKFVGNDQMKGTDVSVKTTDGVVTLTGTAPTADARSAAEAAAKSVDGVKSVDDQVSLGASATDKMEAKTDHAAKKTGRYAKDSWITTKVKTKLLADSVTKGLNISVETTAGVVKLTGQLPTQSQIDRAIEIAKGTKHVKSVDSADLKVGTS